MRYVVLAGLLAAGAAAAQEPQAAAAATPPAPGDAARKAEEHRRLEEQIAKELGVSPAPAASPGAPPGPALAPPPAPPPASAAPLGGNPFARVLMLPDVSAIGSGALVWNQKDVQVVSPRSDPYGPGGKVQPVFQELEVALQSVVDPYARADVFLTFHPDGAGVEEAYLTTLGLPAGLQIRAGTLKSPFGRMNQQHPHVWDFVGTPLPMARLLAVDALEGPGVDVAWLAPVPWFLELHLAYQDTVPGFETVGRRTGVAHLLQYFDVAEGTTLGVGLSAARLDEPGAGAWRDLYGADLFLKIRPPQGRAYLTLQGELFARRLSGLADAGQDGTRLGGYLQALWRQNAYWGYGVRWEGAPAAGPGLSGAENRWTALATWYPSEFQRLRLQVSDDRLPGGSTGWEALLAMEFIIGAHGAHPF